LKRKDGLKQLRNPNSIVGSQADLKIIKVRYFFSLLTKLITGIATIYNWLTILRLLKQL
jgi:hypothetical protein